MKLYSIKEASKKLGVSYDTLYKMIKNYEIKAAKSKGQWIITEDALNEYIKSHPILNKQNKKRIIIKKEVQNERN